MQDATNLRNLTADGEYVVWAGPPGGEVVVEVDGVWGGATVALGRASLGGNFKAYTEDASPVTLTAGAAKAVLLSGRAEIVLKITGAGGTTSVSFQVDPVKSRYYA